ncbi:hypothetical protein OSTOST_15002, partial [Ostertagia ostertagi]
DEAVNFVSKCLKKLPARTSESQVAVIGSVFIKYADVDDNGEFANFVTETISIQPCLSFGVSPVRETIVCTTAQAALPMSAPCFLGSLQTARTHQQLRKMLKERLRQLKPRNR